MLAYGTCSTYLNPYPRPLPIYQATEYSTVLWDPFTFHKSMFVVPEGEREKT